MKRVVPRINPQLALLTVGNCFQWVFLECIYSSCQFVYFIYTSMAMIRASVTVVCDNLVQVMVKGGSSSFKGWWE